MADCNIRVVARFRPQNEREKKEAVVDDGINIELQRQSANITNKGKKDLFTLDAILPSATLQDEIYDVTAKPTVIDLMNGYNGTIFAYGQTGAGKSFTMFGPDVDTQPQLRGIIPRAIAQIFDTINNDSTGSEFTIKCSFLEIYKENVHDLLNPKSGPLKVRETPARGSWVDGLTEEFVVDEREVINLIRLGEKSRSVAYTNMNATSSRSHSLFTLILQQKSKDGSLKTGKLNLADLAGSEKVGKTGAVGETLDEAKKINQSLSALGNCINALTKQKRGHVPFRDSKLTFILKESLGGNSKTTLVVCCSPDKFNIEETVSTLQFAQRAKMIKNSVSMNKQKSVDELNAIIARLSKELQQMKNYINGLHQQLTTLDPNFKIPTTLELVAGAVGTDGEAISPSKKEIMSPTSSEEMQQILEDLAESRRRMEETQEQFDQEEQAKIQAEAKLAEFNATISDLQFKLTEQTAAVNEQTELKEALIKQNNEKDELIKSSDNSNQSLKTENEEFKRVQGEMERKIKHLQDQEQESNARFDNIIKAQATGEVQAHLAEQLLETKGLLRHRELIISELGEKIEEEESLKHHALEAELTLRNKVVKQDEAISSFSKQLEISNAHVRRLQYEKEMNLQAQKQMSDKIKHLEEQAISFQSTIHELKHSSGRRSHSSSSSSSHTPGTPHSTKSKIVRPVNTKKTTSFASAVWGFLVSPSKVTDDEHSEEDNKESHIVRKEGHLCKQGSKNLKSWKNRKVVLKDRHIIYYSSTDSTQKKGSIPLDAHSVVDSTDEFTFKTNSFGIFNPAHSTLYFYSESSEDCSSWKDAIQSVITKAKSQTTSKLASSTNKL